MRDTSPEAYEIVDIVRRAGVWALRRLVYVGARGSEDLLLPASRENLSIVLECVSCEMAAHPTADVKTSLGAVLLGGFISMAYVLSHAIPRLV